MRSVWQTLRKGLIGSPAKMQSTSSHVRSTGACTRLPVREPIAEIKELDNDMEHLLQAPALSREYIIK
jgi:hypothetical protein